MVQKIVTYKDLAIMMGGSGNFAMGGIESIECNAKVLKDLALQYPKMFDLDEAQNDSPTVGEFLERASDEDTFLTYVVGDGRSDKRISIEGIITNSKEVCSRFLESHPDEFDHKQLNPPYRLWWD